MLDRDFIITSLQSWDIEIGSTIKNTALEISKTNKVLYVNPPLDIASRIRNIFRKGGLPSSFRHRIDVIHHETSPLRQINDNMWVLDCPFTLLSINKFPIILFDIFNRINNKKIGAWILKQAADLNFRNYVHLIDTDIFRSQYLKEYIHPQISIYYRRDYVIGFPYWRKHGPRLEENLVRKSDIVLANSTYFVEQLRPFNSCIYVLNTGVDLNLYDASRQWNKPTDLHSIPFPIIGYTGAIIESRLDSSLIYHIAELLPEYNFAFVGPEDEHFQKHSLHKLENVYFLGRKEITELPQYIQYFDVCINPQILNLITEGNYPLKIDEYLAMGKPVVATSTHTMRDVFNTCTHLATTLPEWVKALNVAVGEANNSELQKSRIAFAHTHSWEFSINKIYQAIKDYENKNTL